MESAEGFYANKPLVVCCGRILGCARQSKKQETTQVGGNSQERSAWRGGPACTTLARCVLLRCGWHAAPPSITCDDESHRRLPPLSPVRTRWRWQSARWRWARRGGCRVQASGWRRPATGGWGVDCGQRPSPRCPADGQSAAGARAKPLGLEGRRSLTLGWGEQRRERLK